MTDPSAPNAAPPSTPPTLDDEPTTGLQSPQAKASAAAPPANDPPFSAEPREGYVPCGFGVYAKAPKE